MTIIQCYRTVYFFIRFIAAFCLAFCITIESKASTHDILNQEKSYQAQLIENSLEELGLNRDLNPDGKIIENIRVVTTDVITANDPWPLFLGHLHQVTHPEIIERELLFQTGKPWTEQLALESERNLRNYLFISLANIIPCQGSQPDKIKVLVITKDLWSLRINTDFSYIGSTLEYLALQLEEANLLGKNKDVKAIFEINPVTLTLLEKFTDPRILGSRIATSEQMGIIQNKTTGNTEGAVAQVFLGQPLYSLHTPWAWNIYFNLKKDIYRLISSGAVQDFYSDTTHETVPIAYHRRLGNAQAAMTRSLSTPYYNDLIKQNLTLGWRGKVSQYSPLSTHLSLQPETQYQFRSRYIPRDESYGSIFLRYDLFLSSFTRLFNIDTFALTEDFRLGPTFTLETVFANPALGWSSSFFQPYASAGYSRLFGDHLFATQIALSARHQPGVIANNHWIDPTISLSFKNITARFGIFRLHTALRLTRRAQHVHSALESLGGDSYLRGYPSQYFLGTQSWSGNLELRTIPMTFHTSHIGGVAFLDLGDAFNSPQQINTHGSLGVGVRVLFPQFNRQVLRADLGFPLEHLKKAVPSYLVLQFGQAF